VDRRTKKRIEVLKKKRANLRTQLATVRRYTDDPAEIPKLESELAAVVAELEKLQAR